MGRCPSAPGRPREKRSKGLNDNQSWCMLEMSCVGVVLEFRVVCVEVCGLCESRSGVNRMAYGTAVNRNIDALSCQDTRTSLVGESNYATFGEDGVLRSRLEQAGSGSVGWRWVLISAVRASRSPHRARTVLRPRVVAYVCVKRVGCGCGTMCVKEVRAERSGPGEGASPDVGTR